MIDAFIINRLIEKIENIHKEGGGERKLTRLSKKIVIQELL
jgi:hypothetical protein